MTKSLLAILALFVVGGCNDGFSEDFLKASEKRAVVEACPYYQKANMSCDLITIHEIQKVHDGGLMYVFVLQRNPAYEVVVYIFPDGGIEVSTLDER